MRPAFEHCFYSGVTQTGKSTCMRAASRLSTKDQIIYDPTHAPVNWNDGWRPGINKWQSFFNSGGMKTEIYHTPNEFLNALRSATDSDVFVDEAGDIFAQRYQENHAIITQGRHRGLRLFIAAQRPQMVSPTVRCQCSLMFLFRLTPSDMKIALSEAGFTLEQLPCAIPQQVGELVTVDGTMGKIYSGYHDVFKRSHHA